jgi:hypothetical protein
MGGKTKTLTEAEGIVKNQGKKWKKKEPLTKADFVLKEQCAASMTSVGENEKYVDNRTE